MCMRMGMGLGMGMGMGMRMCTCWWSGNRYHGTLPASGSEIGTRGSSAA